MRRLISLVALAAALVSSEAARADEFRVVVVPKLDLEAVGARGAVGLLVPGAGPKTSRSRAEAALVRGEVRNSLLGGLPKGRRLIRVEHARGLPDAPAIVLELPPERERSNDRRYPIAVLGRGYHGLLISARTRLPGLVSVVDVAPTALGRDERLGVRPAGNAPAELRRLDRRIEANGDARIPVLALIAVLVLALALAAPAAGVWGLAGGLAANLVLGVAGATQLWVELVAAALGVAAGGSLAWLSRSRTALGAALAVVLAFYLFAPAIDTASLALSPLGPTQNARFYGLSNLLETLLLVPTVGGAALLGTRFGPLGFGVVAALGLVAVGASRLGADGGGAIVFATALAVLALGLWGRRALLPVAAAAVVVATVAAADAATGSSHLADALRNGIADDLVRRLELSYARVVSGWGVGLLVVGGIAALAVLVTAELRNGRRPPLYAFAVAIAASLVLNDSPNDVVVAGLLGYLTLAAASGTGFQLPQPQHGRSPAPSPEPRARTGRVAAP